jgi:hypothetical protein
MWPIPGARECGDCSYVLYACGLLGADGTNGPSSITLIQRNPGTGLEALSRARPMQRLIRFTSISPAAAGNRRSLRPRFRSGWVATPLRLAIDPFVAGVEYITFFPAIMIMTSISGFGAGLFCAALSVAAAAFFVLPSDSPAEFLLPRKRPDTAQEDTTSRPSIATMLRLRADKRARRRAD